METAKDLVSTYSVVGDVSLIILCVLFFVILKINFIKSDRKYTLMRASIVFLFVAAISNILFYFAAINEMPDVTLYVTRDIYHIILLLMFVLYDEYICDLLDVGISKKRHIGCISFLICLIACFFDCMSPVFKVGFYKDAMGIWHDHSYIKPFTMAYAVNMIFTGVFVLKNKKHIVKKALISLMFTIGVCIFVVILENFVDSNSYLAITFALPVLIVLFEFHSNSFNTLNGSRDFKVFAFFLEERSKSNKETSFMCLKLNLEESLEIPKSLSKLFYSFYTSEFKHAELFATDLSTYVLAVPIEKETDVRKKIDKLIYEVFPKYYSVYKIKYKIILIDQTIIKSIEKFETMYSYYLNKMEDNAIFIIDNDEMNKYQRTQKIVSALKDIDINKDLNDDRVLVYCQPVKNTHTEKFDTAEALMRLQLPELGMIYPDEFIPLAEEYGYIHTMSLIILNKTCKTIKKMVDEGYDLSRISVNFSISELSDINFIDDFKQIVTNNGIEFEKVGVELTESQNDKDYETVFNIVKILKELKVVIYLDDFGSGYSNFDRILKLNFDVIKLDRSLLLLSEKQEKLNEFLACFAKAFDAMGYKILYEGVESDGHEKKCTDYSADYLQGYKYSKPIPIAELENFVEKI